MKAEVQELDFIALFDTLTLAKAEDGGKDEEWIVYIEATNDIPDLEDEAVQVKAIEEALGYFLEDGKLTWEHVTPDKRHDPSIFIGEPLEAGIAKGRLFVKAKLWKHVQKARDVWDILQSGGKLKASVGGFVKEKKDEWNRWAKKKIPTISKFVFNHLAITPWPINQATSVQTVPIGTFAKSLWSGHEACTSCECDDSDPDGHCEYAKALTAGAGLSPSTMTGGRALIPEELDPKVKITADLNRQEGFYCDKHQREDGSFRSRKAMDEHLVECVGLLPLNKSLEVKPMTVKNEFQDLDSTEESKGLAGELANAFFSILKKSKQPGSDKDLDTSAESTSAPEDGEIVVVNDILEGFQKSLNTLGKQVEDIHEFREPTGKALIGIAQRVDKMEKSVNALVELVQPMIELSKSTAEEIKAIGDTPADAKSRGVALAKSFDEEDTDEQSELKPHEILSKAMALQEKGNISLDEYHRLSVGIRQNVYQGVALDQLPVYPLIQRVAAMAVN